MATIRTLPEFDQWLDNLRDAMTIKRLRLRLQKAQAGNMGDIALVGDGVYEMREHFGQGWRMYYVQRGSELILMLGGGDKASQQADINKAKQLAKTVED